MAYQDTNLRLMADDRGNNPRFRSLARAVNDIQIFSYVTDDSLADVTGPTYWNAAHRRLTRDDIILFSAAGGWGFVRIESSDRGAVSVTVSEQNTGVGGGGGGAVTSVAGNVGNVSTGQLITAIDSVAGTNFLTDIERAAITNALSVTAAGVAPGATQFPALAGTPIIPSGTLQAQLQALKTELDGAGGGLVNTVANVTAVAGDIPLAALLTALGITNIGSGAIITATERANLAAAFADVANQLDIQALLGVAAGINTLPAIPAGTGTALNAGDLVAQLAELKNRIDAGGGGIGGDLTALEALAATGFAVRTAADTWAQRSLIAPVAGLTIANGDGIGGDPTFALANDLAALEALAANGLAERTGVDTWAVRAIGLAAANIVERSDRFGVQLGDNAAAPNGQFWFIDEADDQAIQFRYGADDATASRRAEWPVTPGAAGTVLTSQGGGATAWQATASPSRIVADATARDALTTLTAGEKVIVLDDDGNGNSEVYEVSVAGATFAVATTVRSAAIPTFDAGGAATVPTASAGSPDAYRLINHSVEPDQLLVKLGDNSAYALTLSSGGGGINSVTGGAGITNSGTAADPVLDADQMTGATAGAAGTAGTVPAPAAGDQVNFLRGDGAYANPVVPFPAGAAGEHLVADGVNSYTNQTRIPFYNISIPTGFDGKIRIKAPHNLQIAQTFDLVDSGSFDYTVDINGTNVTGLTGISVSLSAETPRTATANRDATTLQTITLTISNNSSAVNGYIGMRAIQTGLYV